MEKRIGKSVLVSVEINELPTPLILEILLKLPVKSVLRCKCVCKYWYELITSPHFTIFHRSNPPFACLVLSEARDDILSRDFLSLLEIGRGDNVIRTPLDLKPVGLPKNGVLQMEGSCNGLICLVWTLTGKRETSNFINFRQQQIYVLNLLSRKYVELPQPSSPLNEIFNVCYGFGSSVSSNCGKIVRMVNGLDLAGATHLSFEIFTLWVDTKWRSFEGDSITLFTHSCGVNLNGFLNWVAQDKVSCFIYAFNVEEEKGRRISLPPAFGMRLFRVVLTVLDGNICLADVESEVQVAMWTMKRYGVVESWTKDVVLRSWIPHVPSYFGLIPLKKFGNGEILIYVLRRGMFSYDPTTKRCREVKVQDLKEMCFICPYNPNFSMHFSF